VLIGPVRHRRRRARCAALVIIAGGLWAGLATPSSALAQASADDDYVGTVLSQALESERTGVTVPWHNPATGSRGTIVIERTFYRDPDTPCRDYRRTLERPGSPGAVVTGTGCRIAAGRWSLDEKAPEPARAARLDPAAPEPPAPPAPASESAAAAPSCPALTAVPVPCARPPAVADYTMPTRTEL
jgi:surface antigen